MSVEHSVSGARLRQRMRAERGLREAAKTLQERRAELRRAGASMKLQRGQVDIVEVADAAMAYQGALDKVRFYQDELRRLNGREP